nr:nucleotidyl transferase AbiEii/AbiGii toxin family protein [Cognataquiflexum nitidum]
MPQVSSYIRPRVLIEIRSRSMHEPLTQRPIKSFVGDYFAGRPFADLPTNIPCVNVERTFLEKIFLLHEEFQKPESNIRIQRLSRHLYDIERIMASGFAGKALAGPNLYQEIVKHRSSLTRINGMDYTRHSPRYINPIPPDHILKYWEDDYKTMQEQMIYGDSLSFKELIEKLKTLRAQINKLDWKVELK